MGNKVDNRNQAVDIFRGLAIIMVVMGHTIAGSVSNYSGSFLFNLIWTLQIPFFMLISGYVSKYSRPISTIGDLWSYLKRRTFAYMLPWLVWTCLIRGLIFANYRLLDPKFLFWHMDVGYWFPPSLWTICVMFGIGQYLAAKLGGKLNWLLDTILAALYTCLASTILIAGAKFFGITFFGIKYTLYYTPFFLAGFVYSKAEANFKSAGWFVYLKDAAICISALFYFAILLRYDFYDAGESVCEIFLRITASITGSITFFGVGSMLINSLTGKGKYLSWIGSHSLEIYLIHFLVSTPVKMYYPDIHSVAGVLKLSINFTWIMAISILAIILINQSKIAKKLLFAK